MKRRTQRARCICEACKTERAEARSLAQARRAFREHVTRTLDSAIVDEYRLKAERAVSEMGIYKGRLQRFEAILGRIQSSRNAEWPSSSGTVRVQAMNTSHLHYAIAKGERGEYPRGCGYGQAMQHLKNEALRRLIGGTWPESEGPLT